SPLEEASRLGFSALEVPKTDTLAYETPVTDSSGILMVTQQGVLVLLKSTESIIWSSNLTKPKKKNPVAELLESGNL
ncbi:G-type lectin S-receptor-like serine/threonine-protein kinase, partial [Camellia lanceoleosa]